MARTFSRAWLAGVAAGLLSGCAGGVGGMVASLDGRHAAVELQHVPFHAQVTDQCGPAALAMVLNEAGVAVSPETLKARVYIPGRQGALQVELLAAARQFDRIPYEIDPSLSALVAELDAGRPVLVLQNLGATIAPIWHYAVVVGYLPEHGKFVLRSGDRQRHLVRTRSFTRSWKRGELWGVVVLQPGVLPAHPDADRYLRAVAAAESTGGASSAAVSYRAATTEWPKNSLAWLGLGNTLYAQGDLRLAESAYRHVLEIDPVDAVAMNNLAQVYVDMGCRDKALGLVETALQRVATEDPVRAHLLLTRDGIEQSETGSRCR